MKSWNIFFVYKSKNNRRVYQSISWQIGLLEAGMRKENI